MDVGAIAAIVAVSVMPFIAGLGLYVRHRRQMQLRDWIMAAGRGNAGDAVQHDGLHAPDGRTLVELARLRNSDREKTRAMLERLAMKKLDIIQSGVNLGYKEADLKALDERLEKVIGGEKLAGLLANELPSRDLSSEAAPPAAVKDSVQQPQ